MGGVPLENRLRKFVTYPFYRKFFLIYILSVAVFTVVVFTSLLGLVTRHLHTYSEENSEKILAHMVTVSEYLKDDVDYLSSMVSSHASTNSFLTNAQENKLANYHLYYALNQFKAHHPYIVDISVINLDQEVSVQTTGTNVNDGLNVAWVEMLPFGKNQILRRTVHFYDQNRTYEVISFLYFLPSYHGAILVDVDVERFGFLIDDNGENDHRVAVVDAQGVWLQYPDQFPLPPLDAYQLREIFQGQDEAEDFFVYQDENAQLVLYFAKSDLLNWWFIDAQSYPKFISAISTLGMAFLGIMLVFLALCTVMSVIYGRQMRKPLVRLVKRLEGSSLYPSGDKYNEIQYLERLLSQVEHESYLNEKHLDSMYLSQMLFGRELPSSLLEKRFKTLRMKYDAPFYSVLLLKLYPAYMVREEERDQEFGLLRYTIGNLAEEIFSKFCECYASDGKEDSVALLLLLSSPQMEEECRRHFDILNNCAEEHFRIRLSACLGPVVNQFDSVYDVCQKACSLMEMDNMTAPGIFLNTENINPPSYQEKTRNLVDLIERHTMENYADQDLSLKGIAKEQGFSPVYLGKVFKSVKGVSYHTFLTNLRLEKSLQILQETNKTVSEIAAQVGFSSATYFSTVFKNTFGMTPSAYRGTARDSGRKK